MVTFNLKSDVLPLHHITPPNHGQLNPFMPCPIKGTLANSVDPAQMLHNTLFALYIGIPTKDGDNEN